MRAGVLAAIFEAASEEEKRIAAEQLVPYLPSASATAGDPLMTPQEVADYLRCYRSRVYGLVRGGQLEALHDGTRLLIRESAVQRYLADE